MELYDPYCQRRMERTQLINHVRGLLAEYGIVFSKGATELRQKLPALLEDAENELTDTMRTLLHRQYILSRTKVVLPQPGWKKMDETFW